MRNGNNCKWTCGTFRSEWLTAIGLPYEQPNGINFGAKVYDCGTVGSLQSYLAT